MLAAATTLIQVFWKALQLFSWKAVKLKHGLNLRDLFIKTNVIGEYADLILGHWTAEQLKSMTTPKKLQNSRGAQQNSWKQPSISVL